MSRNRWTEIICLAAVMTAIACFAMLRSPQGQTVRREVGREGGLVVVGRGASPFASEYRAASGLLADGAIAEAEAIYKKLVEKEPTSPYPYLGLASCRARLGDPQGALQLYQKAFETDPKSPYALVGMGSCYVSVSDYAKAIEKYEAAIVLDEKTPDAHRGLAVACAHLGQNARARRHLDRFKQLAPDSRHIKTLEDLVDGTTTQPATQPGKRNPDAGG